MDQTDCRKLSFDVFQQYLELLMSKRHVLEVVRNVRGNLMTHMFAKMSHLWLCLSQVLKLEDPTDCRMLFLGVFSMISQATNVGTMCLRMHWKH